MRSWGYDKSMDRKYWQLRHHKWHRTLSLRTWPTSAHDDTGHLHLGRWTATSWRWKLGDRRWPLHKWNRWQTFDAFEVKMVKGGPWVSFRILKKYEFITWGSCRSCPRWDESTAVFHIFFIDALRRWCWSTAGLCQWPLVEGNGPTWGLHTYTQVYLRHMF